MGGPNYKDYFLGSRVFWEITRSVTSVATRQPTFCRTSVGPQCVEAVSTFRMYPQEVYCPHCVGPCHRFFMAALLLLSLEAAKD